MSRNLALGMGVSICVVAGLIVATSAGAQQAAAKKGHSEVAKELHQAHKLLSEADHDYDGHRKQAAEEVHKALKEVGAEKKAVGHPPEKKPGGHEHEPQAKSDAQLHKAMDILEKVHPKLVHHHPKAAVNVQTAIAEIKAALKIK